MEKVLNNMGLVVQKTIDEYKLRVLRLADETPITLSGFKTVDSINSGLGAPESVNSSGNERNKLKLSKFAQLITSFPVSLMKRFKYMAQFGAQYNSGFDAHTDPLAIRSAHGQVQKEISFSVVIQRIRNLDGLLIVQVNRHRGDIWQFKKLYYDIVAQLDL